MQTLRIALKSILISINKMVDDGDCDNITINELQKIHATICQPKSMGREEAAKFLGVSLNMFHDF